MPQLPQQREEVPEGIELDMSISDWGRLETLEPTTPTPLSEDADTVAAPLMDFPALDDNGFKQTEILELQAEISSESVSADLEALFSVTELNLLESKKSL